MKKCLESFPAEERDWRSDRLTEPHGTTSTGQRSRQHRWHSCAHLSLHSYTQQLRLLSLEPDFVEPSMPANASLPRGTRPSGVLRIAFSTPLATNSLSTRQCHELGHSSLSNDRVPCLLLVLPQATLFPMVRISSGKAGHGYGHSVSSEVLVATKSISGV